MLDQPPPDFRKLLLAHLAVADADARLGHPRLDAGGDALDGGDVVVQVVDLPAAAQFLLDRVRDDAGVVLEHVRLHGVPVVRRLLDDRHVADAGERHVQRAGDRRRRKRQHVGRLADLLEALLLLDAEALLLVDDDEAEVLELHVLGDKPVRADDQVDAAALQLAQDLVLLLRRAEAREQLDVDREALHAL